MPLALPISTLCCITQITFSEQHKSWSPPLCSFHHPRHFLPPTPTYLPQHPLPNPPHNFTDPNKTTHHITVLHICNNSPSAYYNVTTFNSSQLHCMCVWTSDHFCRMPQFDFHCRAKPKRGVQGRLPTHLQVSYTYILNTSTTYTYTHTHIYIYIG
jgi:hypothetical protein